MYLTQKIKCYGIKILLLSFLLLNIALAEEERGCSTTGNSYYSLREEGVPSFNLDEYQENMTLIANAGLNCRFSFLAVLPLTDWIQATVTGDHALKNELDMSEEILFKLYRNSKDKGKKEELEYDVPSKFLGPQLLNILGLFGGREADLPFYIEILPEVRNLKSGNYYARVNVNWQWHVCKGIAILGCLAGLSESPPGGKNTQITIHLKVLDDCLISATNIHFGARAFVTEFEPVSGTIMITCTKGTAYNVGLTNGDHFEDNQRNMKFGDYSIPYDIYKETGGRWGEDTSERWASSDASERPGPGNGLRNGGQIYKYKAEIMSDVDNIPKPAGTYIDHVVIDVGF